MKTQFALELTMTVSELSVLEKAASFIHLNSSIGMVL